MTLSNDPPTKMSRKDRLQDERQIRRFESISRAQSQAAAGEVDATIFLHNALKPRRYIPPAGGWAASYETLAYLVDLVLHQEGPMHIVELGSGVSTIWLGLACKEQGNSRLTSLEHETTYLDRTKELARRHGLDNIVNIVHAPLSEHSVGEHNFTWYTFDAQEITDINLLFVDGPPGVTGRNARYPALSLLRGRLADPATIVVDDTDRHAESEIVSMWIREAERFGESVIIHDQISRSTVLHYAKSL